MRAAGPAFARLVARRLLKLGCFYRRTGTERRRGTIRTHRPHCVCRTAPPARGGAKKRLTRLSPSPKGGGGGRSGERRGLALLFRHQLPPQPNPPPPHRILDTATATTSAPPSLLPMPLSSPAPLPSLASIWIEAPCFSSYKSR